MIVKGMNGENHSVTSQGQGNLNTVLGAVGTYGTLMGGGLGNFFGGYNNRNGGAIDVITAEDRPISRYEAKMMQELAAKDGKIALLESNIYTDQKITEVYDKLASKINANKEAQDAINMQQAVYNGTNTATIGCLKSQIAELQSLSELVIPRSRVCNTNNSCDC
jgi:hypothetical protein